MEWVEKVKSILQQHSKRREDIIKILDRLLSDNKLRMRYEKKLINKNDLVWNIELGGKIFQLSNAEILEEQKIVTQDKDGFSIIAEEKRDLEEAIKELILKKIS